jgi:hypothetical protein
MKGLDERSSGNMPTKGDIAPDNRAGPVGEKDGREGRAEPEPTTQAAGWDVERVCLWARENRIPEFQAVARREDIDGELAMLEGEMDGEPVAGYGMCLCLLVAGYGMCYVLQDNDPWKRLQRAGAILVTIAERDLQGIE